MTAITVHLGVPNLALRSCPSEVGDCGANHVGISDAPMRVLATGRLESGRRERAAEGVPIHPSLGRRIVPVGRGELESGVLCAARGNQRHAQDILDPGPLLERWRGWSGGTLLPRLRHPQLLLLTRHFARRFGSLHSQVVLLQLCDTGGREENEEE